MNYLLPECFWRMSSSNQCVCVGGEISTLFWIFSMRLNGTQISVLGATLFLLCKKRNVHSQSITTSSLYQPITGYKRPWVYAVLTGCNLFTSLRSTWFLPASNIRFPWSLPKDMFLVMLHSLTFILIMLFPYSPYCNLLFFLTSTKLFSCAF